MAKRETATQRAARREQIDRDAACVVRWARMAMIIRELAIDPRMSSLCGRMLLIEQPYRLGAKEFEASVRLAQVLDDYDRLVLGVKRGAQAQDIDKAKGLSCGGETPAAAIRAASAAWVAAQGAMGLGGHGCASATMALVREDGYQGREQLGIAGLRALAVFWKISDVPEPRIKRAVAAIFERAA